MTARTLRLRSFRSASTAKTLPSSGSISLGRLQKHVGCQTHTPKSDVRTHWNSSSRRGACDHDGDDCGGAAVRDVARGGDCGDLRALRLCTRRVFSSGRSVSLDVWPGNWTAEVLWRSYDVLW